MAWRFQRRKRILPGVTLNFSKSGASFTLGGRWFKTNFGAHGQRHTFTLPGTGWSHVSYAGRGRGLGAALTQRPPGRYDRQALRRRWIELLLLFVIGNLALVWAFPAPAAGTPTSAVRVSDAEILSYLAWITLCCVQVVRSVLTWTTPMLGSDMASGPEPLSTMAADPDIADTISRLDPIEFEMAVAGLLERMGLQVRTTPRSGDGGVDIIAVDPAPVTGGLIVVQCKHTQVVGSPVIRDLYGAMAHHGANKGIVATSGRFTSDATAWATGKPIELIDGGKLADLINRHR